MTHPSLIQRADELRLHLTELRQHLASHGLNGSHPGLLALGLLSESAAPFKRQLIDRLEHPELPWQILLRQLPPFDPHQEPGERFTSPTLLARLAAAAPPDPAHGPWQQLLRLLDSPLAQSQGSPQALHWALALELSDRKTLSDWAQDPARSGCTEDEFDQALARHLHQTGRCSEVLAGLAACAVRPLLPIRHQVMGLPPTHRWGRTLESLHLDWAVALAEAIAPGSAPRQTVEQLLDQLAAAREEPSLRKLVQHCLVQPLIRWARSFGLIGQVTPDTQQLESLLRAFANWEADQLKGRADIGRSMPERLAMARDALPHLGLAPDDRLKQVRRHKRDRQHTALDVMAARTVQRGTDDWSLGARVFPVERFGDIAARFETEYPQWLAAFESAWATLLTSLLDALPAADRTVLCQGHTEVLSVEPVQSRQPGRSGLLLRAVHGSTHHVYELFPYLNLIRRRDDLALLQPDRADARAPQTWQPARAWALDLHAHTWPIWPRPTAAQPLYVLSLKTFGPGPWRNWCNDLSRWLARHYAIPNRSAHRHAARGATTFDKQAPVITALKLVLPLWGSIDAILEAKRTGNHDQGIVSALLLTVEAATLVLPVNKGVSLLGRTAAVMLNVGTRSSLPVLGRASVQLARLLAVEFTPLGTGLRLGRLGRKGWRWALRRARGNPAALALLRLPRAAIPL